MRILADENIPGLEETFGLYGELQCYKGREISSAQLAQVDVLLVRSVTRVNRQLLLGSSVKFVGSATIGVDHLNVPELDQAGVRWCHAPGCNADAAAQYTLAMIILATRRCGLQIPELKAGIVGLGNVGSRLKRLLVAAGVGEVIACDPPLADAGYPGLVGMEKIAGCNLVSFHVPLKRSGPYSTKSLGNQQFFSRLLPGTLLVNSSRGEVLDATALDDWLDSGGGFAALDVWPDEPNIEGALLAKVAVATPHVAGYSLEGKLNGTRELFRQFLDWQRKAYPEPMPPVAPPPEDLLLPNTRSIDSIILAACPVERDDASLRASFAGKNHISAAEFDELRKNYPNRRDFAGIRIAGEAVGGMVKSTSQFGFFSEPA